MRTLFCMLEDKTQNLLSDPHPLRKLRRSIAHPDKCTQQNANEARLVFEEETMGCLLQLVTNQSSAESNPFDDIVKDFDGWNGFSGEVLEMKLSLLGESVC